MKSPVLATILNIIPGFGYIYIGGKKRWFGLMLVVAIGLNLYVAISSPNYQQTIQEAIRANGEASQTASFDQEGVLSLLVSLLMLGAFMYDGYLSCRQANAEYDAKIKAKITSKG